MKTNSFYDMNQLIKGRERGKWSWLIESLDLKFVCCFQSQSQCPMYNRLTVWLLQVIVVKIANIDLYRCFMSTSAGCWLYLSPLTVSLRTSSHFATTGRSIKGVYALHPVMQLTSLSGNACVYSVQCAVCTSFAVRSRYHFQEGLFSCESLRVCLSVQKVLIRN